MVLPPQGGCPRIRQRKGRIQHGACLHTREGCQEQWCLGERADGEAQGRPVDAEAGSGKEAARQGQARLAREPGGLRQRPGAHDPDPRARVRRLRHRGGQVPARRADRGAVHRFPPQAGGLRPAPARRADDPGEAALRRGQPRTAGGVRRRYRAAGPAQQGAHHHPSEHPDPPHPPRRRGRIHPPDQRSRALLARGLRQHDPQRDRRPLGGRGRGRALRRDPLRRGLRALLRPPPHHPADAAQGEDRLLRLRRRPRNRRHPRRRLHPEGEASRGQGGAGRRDPDRWRHLDHAEDRSDPLRVRRARQRRLPQGHRGRAPHLRPPGLAAREQDAGPDQGPGRQDRNGRLPGDGRRGAQGRLGQGT